MSRQSRSLAVLIGAALLAACGDSPSGPSGPLPPPPPGNATITTVRIEGPASVAPGSSAQFRLIATFTDGTTSDVAAQALWFSNNASVLSIASPGGLATAKSRGEAHLSATYRNRAGNANVLVLEDGTYRVRGGVLESGAGLSGARVEVLAGTGAGLTATSDSAGAYALYGLAGDVQLEASLNGFEKERLSLVVTGHTSANIVLRPSIEPSDFRGDWQLTVNAAAACGSAIPQEASTRSYAVTMTQAGSFVQVQFKGATVETSWLPLTGRVIAQTATFSLPTDDFYYPFYGLRFYALVEALGSGRHLALSGTMRGDRSGSFVAGDFVGEFALYRSSDGQGGVWSREVSCERSDHRFRFDKN